jgi:peptidoglycan/xylan/chitin deacetylase (PgdA/CDA1 family)
VGVTRLPVLMYHAVTPVRGRFARLGLPAAALGEQLHALRDAGYRLVGVSEALRIVDRDPAAAVAALTFDDAYADFLGAAVPVLQELGARATLYVPTGHVGGAAGWLGAAAPDLPPLLSWPGLAECVASGCVEIGSHGIAHAQLDTLGADAVAREVGESRRVLEEALGAARA